MRAKNRPICKGLASVPGYPGRKRPCERRVAEGQDYCAWHHPDRVVKKAEAPSTSGYLASARRVLLLEDSLTAVRLIAAGHRDPKQLCQNILTQFDKEGGLC